LDRASGKFGADCPIESRGLYFLHQEEIILLHGFIKKTKKTPNEDRALALRRKNAYVKNG
jgi:phage-related protein